MRKVILYIAISVDEYIADAAGSVDWLGGVAPDYQGDYGYGEFAASVDTVVMGGRTYRQVVGELSPEQWAYEGMTTYVVTHQMLPDQAEIKFINEPAAALIRRLKQQPGRDIWICGGAEIVGQLLEADLIDEYQLSIMPVILGGGIRLFSEGRRHLLRLRSSREENGVLTCIYERR